MTETEENSKHKILKQKKKKETKEDRYGSKGVNEKNRGTYPFLPVPALYVIKIE